MRRINPYEFYELGTAVNAMKLLKESPTLSEAWAPLTGLKQKLDALLKGDTMEVTFSRYDAAALASAIGRLVRRHFYDENGELALKKDWA